MFFGLATFLKITLILGGGIIAIYRGFENFRCWMERTDGTSQFQNQGAHERLD